MRRKLMHTSMNKSNLYDIEVPQNQPLVKPIQPMNYSLQIKSNNKRKDNLIKRDNHFHMRYSSNLDTIKSSSHRIRHTHTLLSKSIQKEKEKQKEKQKNQRRINVFIQKQKGESVQRQRQKSKNFYNHHFDLEQIEENPIFSARKSVLYPNMDFKKFVKHFAKKQQEQQDSSIFFSDKLNELNVSQVVRKATHTSNMKVRTPFVHFNLKFLINKKKHLNLQLQSQSSRITGSNLPYYQTLTSEFNSKQKGFVSQRQNPQNNRNNKFRSIELELKLQNIQKQVNVNVNVKS